MRGRTLRKLSIFFAVLFFVLPATAQDNDRIVQSYADFAFPILSMGSTLRLFYQFYSENCSAKKPTYKAALDDWKERNFKALEKIDLVVDLGYKRLTARVGDVLASQAAADVEAKKRDFERMVWTSMLNDKQKASFSCEAEIKGMKDGRFDVDSMAPGFNEGVNKYIERWK